MFIIGALIFIVGVVYTAAICLNFDFQQIMWILIDMPTVVIFIILITSVIIATGNFKTLVKSINALISKKYKMSAADKERGVRLFKLLSKTVIYTMSLTTIIAFMTILLSLTDPAQLGPKVAVALYSLAFGLGLNLIIINPAIDILQTKYNNEEKTVISERQIIDKLLELCYRQGVSPEEILDANEIHFRKQQ